MYKDTKKDSLLKKAANVTAPLLVYYGVYMASLLLLSWFLRMVAGESETGAGAGKLFGEYHETVTGIVNGVSMLIGAASLFPVLWEELQQHRRQGQRENITVAAAIWGRSSRGKGSLIVVLTALSAISSSMGLNILLSLTGLVQKSADYQEVAQRQYGVVFGVGLVLYTVVSPLAEEVVFRGVIYNRLRRCFTGMGNTAAVVLSGLLFGVYHGNLVQGIYGGCMGILMAYLYEKTHAFCIPVLFHASANCAVYWVSQNTIMQEKIFTLPCCAVLLAVTAAVTLIIEKTESSNNLTIS